MSNTIAEFIDTNRIQKFTDSFYKATGIPSSIITTDGAIITGSGWQTICAQFHRRNPKSEELCIQSDSTIRARLINGQRRVFFQCPHGLIDAAAPIIINGEHVANYLTGQFLFNRPGAAELTRFKEQAQRYGFEEKAYLNALTQVPIITEDRMAAILEYLTLFAEMVADMGLKHQKLLETTRSLKRSEEKFAKAFMAGPDIMMLTRLKDGLVVDANDHYFQASGFKRAEVIGKTAAELNAWVAEKDRATFVDQLRRNQKIENMETVLRKKDGTIKPYVVSARLIDMHGEQCVISNTRDVSEQKAAQEALYRSEKKLRAILDSATASIVLLDRQGVVLEANGVGVKWFNIARDKLIGATVWQFFPLKIAERRRAEVERVFATGQAVRNIDRCNERWGEYSINPVYDEDGAITAVAIYAQDITEKIESEQRLKEQEKKYHKLFDMESDAIFMIDQHSGRILEANRAAVAMYGYSKDELLALKNTDLSAEPDKTHRATMQQTEIVPIRYHKKNDGTIFPVEITGAFFEWNDKAVHIAAIRDISLRIQAMKEKAALEAKIQEAQKIEAIGVLAGGIAHDFNNILAPILGYTEMLMGDFEPTSSTHAQLDEIMKATIRARDLVKQILTFSRQAEREIKPLKLHTVLNEVINLTRSILPTTIEIAPHIDTACGMVMADATQIHQVAMNLVTNAYQAMQKRGGRLAVRLEEVRFTTEELPSANLSPGRYAHLAIEDTGVGMDEETLAKIFNPYFTTKPKGKGTGLGLSVVHGIVKSCGGEILARSKINQGSIFTVYLPTITAAEVPLAKRTDVESDTGSETLLVVDDEQAIVKLQTQILGRLGYNVVPHASSIEALEAFRAQPDRFDAVITDMTMPYLSGDNLAEELLKIRPALPIIICTGYSELISPEKAKQIGIKGFLMKPIVKTELATMLRKVIDAKHRHQDHEPGPESTS